MYNRLKCMSKLYSAMRLGLCEELKFRAVHQSVRSTVEYRYLHFDTFALEMMMIMMTMIIMVV
jgi:hypothetical protein